VLVVTGGSQGGQQALVTAGIHPKITCAIANIPAGCDVNAPQAGRAAGYPYWFSRAKDNPKVWNEIKYFDAATFAARIKCPALVGLGLIDETCPPAGVFAAFNQIQGPKEVVILRDSNHQGTGGTQKEYYKRAEQWIAALVKGEPAPVNGK
jgi:cephalosporin-C deacetylase-like acetyl esterase